MRDKRGLSGVIVTLITVLLAIVAIGIVWVVISNLIGTYTDKIEMGVNAVTLKVVDNQISENDSLAIITIKRGVGEGEVSGIKITFEKDDGETFSVDWDLEIEEQEKRTIEVDLSEQISTGDYIKSFTISPKIQYKDEQIQGSFVEEADRKSPENLARNPDMESWITNCIGIGLSFESPTTDCPSEYMAWDSPVNPLIAHARHVAKGTDAHSGEYSAKMYATEWIQLGQGSISGTGIEADTKYIATSWVKCPDSGLKIRIAAQGVSTQYSETITCDGEWHYLSTSFASKPSGSDYKIYFGAVNGGAGPGKYFYVDDVSVYKSIATS